MPKQHSGKRTAVFKQPVAVAAVVWTLLIFLLCFLPAEDIPEVQVPFADKWVHLVLFGVFSFLWLSAVKRVTLPIFALVLAASIVLGWLVEVIQGQLPSLHRSQDMMDTLADAVGGFLGVLCFAVYVTFFRRTKM